MNDTVTATKPAAAKESVTLTDNQSRKAVNLPLLPGTLGPSFEDRPRRPDSSKTLGCGSATPPWWIFSNRTRTGVFNLLTAFSALAYNPS